MTFIFSEMNIFISMFEEIFHLLVPTIKCTILFKTLLHGKTCFYNDKVFFKVKSFHSNNPICLCGGKSYVN